MVAVQRGEDLEHALLGAHVDPARRLGDEEEPGLEGHGACDADLLLIPSREPPHLLRGTRRPDVERSDHLERVRAHGSMVHHAERLDGERMEEPPMGLERRERDVELDRFLGQEAYPA